MKNIQKIQRLISEGLHSFNSGNLISAEKLFTEVLELNQNELNALYFMGAIRRKQNRNNEAKQYWQRALDIKREQPQVLNALANFYKSSGAIEEAITSYKEALTLQANYVEAWFNLGLTYQALTRQQDALHAFEKALTLKSDHPAYLNAYGMALKDTNQLQKAISIYQKLLRIEPAYAKGWYNLAVALRITFEHSEALKSCQKAISYNPKAPEFYYLEGNICFEMGDFDSADIAYRRALALKPDYDAVHVSLNKLYWEHKKDDLVGKSYEIGVQYAPSSPNLWNSYIGLLEMTNRHQDAEIIRERAAKHISDNPEYLVLCAQKHARDGNTAAAKHQFEKALSFDENRKSTLVNYAQFLIQETEYTHALKQLELAGHNDPNNQEIWAYKGLCWQLMGDERAEWLNNFDQFVKAAQIPIPSGYTLLSDFLTELLCEIKTYHTSKHQPIDQTLRGGSQTFGKLLDRAHPLVQQLKSSIKDVVQDYITTLPDDPLHPLLRRKPDLNNGGFDFSASWSVWLKDGGFHVNHVHSMGWISSALYLDVPENTMDQDARKEGWIKFGESGLKLGKLEKIGKFIKPEAGMLVLFPSYCWHGTVAFNRKADRITAPFDIIPTSISN